MKFKFRDGSVWRDLGDWEMDLPVIDKHGGIGQGAPGLTIDEMTAAHALWVNETTRTARMILNGELDG